MREEWRSIDLAPSYQISSLGRVKNPHGRVLKADASGRYRRVILHHNSQRTRKCVHQLVARAFLGPAPPGHVVNHKDGQRDHNVPHNLEYVTHGQNLQHAYDVLKRPRNTGSTHGMSKLDESAVTDIRARHAQGATGRSLAARFRCSQATISLIVNNRIWTHLVPGAAPNYSTQLSRLKREHAQYPQR